MPYRNPVVTAKMLATLDVMSGGRVILGAGVGWLREEFEALAAPPFDERGAATDEYIQLMRECWTKEPVEWKGKYYRLASVSVLPKPAQAGGIPIWVGGHTDSDPIVKSKFASNRDLSLARAMAVLRYLVDDAGIKDGQCAVVGFGEYRPLTANDSSASKARNRRVEITVVRAGT